MPAPHHTSLGATCVKVRSPVGQQQRQAALRLGSDGGVTNGTDDDVVSSTISVSELGPFMYWCGGYVHALRKPTTNATSRHTAAV